MSAKHYSGEVGTQILLDCGEDIAAALNTVIHWKKPDGTTGSWAANISGTDSLTYTTIAGDLNQTGVYKVQAGMTLGGWTGRGETAQFIISGLYE